MKCDDAFRRNVNGLCPELEFRTNGAVKNKVLRLGVKRTDGRVMTDLLADDAITGLFPSPHTHFLYRHRYRSTLVA